MKRQRDEDKDEIDNLEFPSETSCLIQSLLDLGQAGYGIRMVFIHQIYALIPNRTLVDSEISDMRHSLDVRIFHTPIGQGLMLSRDYVEDVHSLSRQHQDDLPLQNTMNTFISWLNQYPLISLSKNSEETSQTVGNKTCSAKDATAVPVALTNDDMQRLMQKGFLSSRRDRDVEDYYWISHPRVNWLVTSVLSVRKAAINAVARTRYKEISEKELRKRKFDKQFMHSNFYHHDLVGSGSVIVVVTASGDKFYRLAPR